ncbi:von Willebrand factor A domain-containing protein 7-like [Mercenaria mercenaria]|uniref:von Willebrand factor A domain-containing protein 7-like n=1 Tax=Mercenaria mercenaria TaxID=6596 RepID=UPI00234F5D3A|nr:von Willebrand factor A domain-containing protein 7-like [Mercenaria mercenaria]
MRTIQYVVFAIYFTCSVAFLPNPFSAININDYTHTDITEIGILKAVAQFFEDNPVQQCQPCSKGSLTGITDITARKLYDKYYGGQVSEKRFQEAIDDIVKQNNKVDQDHYTEAMWHFNGEKITEANAKMQTLRDTVIQILNNTAPNYDAAREVIGQYLHLLQMFYSNSNWIELSGSIIYRPLGLTGQPIMATAPPSIDTCRSCGATLHTDCTSNIIVSRNFLTSSYKSGQDVTKPTSKYILRVFNQTGIKNGMPIWSTSRELMERMKNLSYGSVSCGPLDIVSTTSRASGGINKDSMDREYPASLHEEGRRSAIANTNFLDDKSLSLFSVEYGLRYVVGDEPFQDLLQIRAGNSLVFVIDTTGSMGKDIAAVQTKTAEIVRETQGTANAPYNYILVTFNDPGNLTTVQKTKNPDDIQSWLGAIKVHGGDDCPEFSLTGIQAASTVAMPNSQVFVFTDATPKDPQKINYITSLITEKKLRVQFLVTGTCTRRRRNVKSVFGSKQNFYKIKA